MTLVLANAWLLAANKKKPEVDVSEHIDETTFVLWLFLALVFAFFALRPEVWRRAWFKRIDPRPAGLMRIAFGAAILWTFLDLAMVAEILFTDEGLYMTDMARQKYGGRLRNLYDPEAGFEHWYDVLDAAFNRFTILHLRSDPPFVYTVYGIMLTTNVLMILGWRTRLMTVITWFLVNQVYNYTPIFYTGGDTALRTMFFLCMFLRWGEAYSLDSVRRRRKAIAGGATGVPALRTIPGWPQVIMMVQLVCIYFATGLLKSGGTWFDGSALYYALNLDHFYRFQVQGVFTFLHYTGVTRLATWITHYWERLFPLALIGVMLRSFEADRLAGIWPFGARTRRYASYATLIGMWAIFVYVSGLGSKYFYNAKKVGIAMDKDTAAVWTMFIAAVVPLVAVLGYRALRRQAPRAHYVLLNWLLGKRLWLTLGLLFHAGIDLGMNVGTFVQVMVAPYFAWLTAKEIDTLWWFLYTRPMAPGEGDRPQRVALQARPKITPKADDVLGGGALAQWLVFPLALLWRLGGRFADRMQFRAPVDHWVIRHAPGDEATVRSLAALRIFDLGSTIRFEASEDVQPGRVVSVDARGKVLSGGALGKRIVHSVPALWAIYPVRFAPAVARRLVRFPKMA